MKKLTILLLVLSFAQITFGKRTKWQLISENNSDKVKISVFNKVDKSSIRTNPEGVRFLENNIRMKLSIEGKAKKIKISYPYFLTEKKEYYNMPRTFFNTKTNMVYLFIFEKTEESKHFGMKGDVYAYNLDTKELIKETLFNKANFGWYSFFEIAKNGNLELRYFSAAGRFDMKFILTDNGSWKPIRLANMTHEAAEKRYLENR